MADENVESNQIWMKLGNGGFWKLLITKQNLKFRILQFFKKPDTRKNKKKPKQIKIIKLKKKFLIK